MKPPFLSRNSQFREKAEVKKENISIRVVRGGVLSMGVRAGLTDHGTS